MLERRQAFANFTADGGEHLQLYCGEVVDEHVADVGQVLRSRGLDQVGASGGDGDDCPAPIGAASLACHQASTLAAELDPEQGRRVIFIASDSPQAGDRIAGLVGDLGLAAVQLGRIDEGRRLIEAPNALVLRNLIERPLS